MSVHFMSGHFMSVYVWIAIASLVGLLGPAAVAELPADANTASPGLVSFELDVMPIFSKAGCNGGGCHGSLAGKGASGFRSSATIPPPTIWPSRGMPAAGVSTWPIPG